MITCLKFAIMKEQNTHTNSSMEDQFTNEIDPKLISTLVRIVKEEMMAYQHSLLPNLDRRVVLKTASAIEFVEVQKVIRCEAQGRYTTVYFKDNTSLLISLHLKEVEQIFKKEHFIRCHNSHLVNRSAISRYNKTDGGFFEMITGEQIPVARARKDEVIEALQHTPISYNDSSSNMKTS